MTQDRVGANRGQERVVGRRERAVRASAQNRGQIEAEAVDVHLLHPVAQALEDQRPGADAGTGQRVAAAGVVAVHRPRVVGHHVEGDVVDSAKAVGRPVRAGLGRVVVDDVEDNLDICRMQGADHRPELVAGGLGIRRIAGVRGEEVQGHVAPVIALLRVELLNGEQLDHGDPQLLQMRNLVDYTGEGAPALGRDAAVGIPREAADVHLVDDRGVRLNGRRPVGNRVRAGPRSRQDTQWRLPQVRARASGGLAIEPRREEDLPRHGVEQDLLRIVGMPQAWAGGSRTVDPVGVVPRLPISPPSRQCQTLQVLFTRGIQAEFEERPGRVVLGE